MKRPTPEKHTEKKSEERAARSSCDARSPESIYRQRTLIVISIAGTVLMVAASAFKNLDDNPIKTFYYVIIVAVSVIFPIVQMIAQRRAMACDYMRRLDNLHNELDATILKIFSVRESFVDEALAFVDNASALLILTPLRLAWITTGGKEGTRVPTCAFFLPLAAIEEISYGKLTGTLTLRLTKGKKQSFKLHPTKEAMAFHEEIELRVASMPRSASVSIGDPVNSLCLECGRETSRGVSRCTEHEA